MPRASSALAKQESISLIPTQSKLTVNRESTRNLESFQHLTEAEFLGRSPRLGQMIAINKPNDRTHGRDISGFFIKYEDMQAAGWLAGLEDLEEGSFIQPYNQKFGGSTEATPGVMFTRPRLQIVFETGALFEQTDKDNTTVIIGSGNRADNDDEGAINYLWDQKKQDSNNIKIRTWYYCYLMTKDNQRAHALPLILSIKGATGATFSEQLRDFRDKMSTCLSVATGTPKRLGNYDAFAEFVFTPTLELTLVGEGNNQSDAVCAVSYDDVVANCPESALASLVQHTVAENLVADTHAERRDEYCQATMCRYGTENGYVNIKPGVRISPMGIEVPFVKEIKENSDGSIASETLDVLPMQQPAPKMLQQTAVLDKEAAATGEDSSLF